LDNIVKDRFYFKYEGMFVLKNLALWQALVYGMGCAACQCAKFFNKEFYIFLREGKVPIESTKLESKDFVVIVAGSILSSSTKLSWESIACL
jgi:hypothetical protein